MSFNVNVANVWHKINATYANVSSTWRHVPQIYVNVNGTWRPLWSYSWNPLAWSGCSATCGGGTQTRVVQCLRDDGTVWDASVCTKLIGANPHITSQACNTQACGPTCYYSPSISSGTYWVKYYQLTSGYTCSASSITNARIQKNGGIVGSPSTSATTASYGGVTYTIGALKSQQQHSSGCWWYYELCY